MEGDHSDDSDSPQSVKVCLLLALPFLVTAAYFYFTPIVVQLGGTRLFSCGSRFNPPTDAFDLSQCADVYGLYGARSGSFLAVGLLIAVVGVGLFGFGARVDEQAERVSAPSP